MQLLGVTASHGAGARSGGDFESISTVTVGAGGASTITFSSIPATYKHLQLRMICRSSYSGYDAPVIKVGNTTIDTGANYAWHYLYGDTGGVGSSGSSSTTDTRLGKTADASMTSNVFGTKIIDILDYSNTNKYKTIRALGNFDNNGTGQIELDSILWMNTSSITDIRFTLYNSGNYVQYSHFALYGIKAA